MTAPAVTIAPPPVEARRHSMIPATRNPSPMTSPATNPAFVITRLF
jgi:hypothetical protein